MWDFEEIQVQDPDRAITELVSTDPVGFLMKSSDFEERLSKVLGIDISELRALEKQGYLERLISTSFFAVSMKALEALAYAIQNGELPPSDLIRASTELSKTALKLSGRDISKHLVLNEEKLLELLSQTEEVEDAP